MILKKDIAQAMDLLITAYGEKLFPTDDKEKFDKAVNLWSAMFCDDEPEEFLVAVKNCIATLSYPPKIADIKSRISQSRMSGQMTEMEAWSAIREAVKNSSTKSGANESFLSLTPILQKCVGTPSQLKAWFLVSSDTFEGVIASNIQRSYRELAKRESTFYALPKDIQTSQNWMVEQNTQVEMLPEPLPQKSFEERDVEMEINAQVYREKQGIEPNPVYESRVKDFQQPMTEAELKMHEAKEKRKEALRMNSWH